MKKSVAIIGGTVESLATSLNLVKNNYLVYYVDKKRESNFQGRGMILTPRSLNSLKKLGVYDTVLKVGYPLNYQTILSDRGKDYYTYKWKSPQGQFLSISEELLSEIFLQEIKKNSKDFKMFFKESYKIKDKNIEFFQLELKKKFDHIISAEGNDSKIRNELFETEIPEKSHIQRVQCITTCPSELNYEDRVLEWWGHGKRLVLFPLSRSKVCLQLYYKIEEDFERNNIQRLSMLLESMKDLKGYGIQNIQKTLRFELSSQNPKNVMTSSSDFFQNWILKNKNESNIHLLGNPIDPSLFQNDALNFEDSIEILNLLNDPSYNFYNRKEIQFLNKKSQKVSNEYSKNIGSFRSIFRLLRFITYKGFLMDMAMKDTNKF